MDFDRTLALVQALNDGGVEYAVFGGVAVNLHGLVRATEDVDLFIRLTEANVARLKDVLRSLWPDPEIDLITWDDLGGDYPAVQYGPPDEEFLVDIVGRLGEAWQFHDLEVETVTLRGVPVKVVSPRTLYRMKRGTVRPRDHADAAALSEIFDVGGD